MLLFRGLLKKTTTTESGGGWSWQIYSRKRPDHYIVRSIFGVRPQNRVNLIVGPSVVLNSLNIENANAIKLTAAFNRLDRRMSLSERRHKITGLIFCWPWLLFRLFRYSVEVTSDTLSENDCCLLPTNLDQASGLRSTLYDEQISACQLNVWIELDSSEAASSENWTEGRSGQIRPLTTEPSPVTIEDRAIQSPTKIHRAVSSPNRHGSITIVWQPISSACSSSFSKSSCAPSNISRMITRSEPYSIYGLVDKQKHN